VNKIIVHSMCVVSFFELLFKTFLILRTERDMIKKLRILVFMRSTRYSYLVLLKLVFSPTDFRKILKHQIP